MNYPKLAASFAVCFLAALIGSVFTAGAIPTWYANLAKPEFTPPGWLFGPAWTVLYILMAIAAYIVWEKGLDKPGVRTALAAFLVQLALNALWSIIFFGLRSPAGAFAEVVVLWLAILVTMILFFRVSKAAGWLFVPYILWVSFAAVLNFTLWIMNLGIMYS